MKLIQHCKGAYNPRTHKYGTDGSSARVRYFDINFTGVHLLCWTPCCDKSIENVNETRSAIGSNCWSQQYFAPIFTFTTPDLPDSQRTIASRSPLRVHIQWPPADKQPHTEWAKSCYSLNENCIQSVLTALTMGIWPQIANLFWAN